MPASPILTLRLVSSDTVITDGDITDLVITDVGINEMVIFDTVITDAVITGTVITYVSSQVKLSLIESSHKAGSYRWVVLVRPSLIH